MWTKGLLALAAAVFLAAALFLLSWAFVRTWGEFAYLTSRLRHRLRNPWADEDQALAELQGKVKNLDPALTGQPPQGSDTTPEAGAFPEDPGQDGSSQG